MKPIYRCAQQVEQVQRAWAVVYQCYRRQGLISRNALGIHAVPHAIGSHACVIYEEQRHTVLSTMTVMADRIGGLPLDNAYPEALDRLRQQGTAMVEVGLFADRRQSIKRTAKALFAMMRWVAYYTLHHGRSDIVIGIHPHHAGFYKRCFGFELFGKEKKYSLVNDNPVVPLRLPLRDAMTASKLPRGLDYIRNNPLPAKAFSQRFRFDQPALQGSLIERLLGRQTHEPATTGIDFGAMQSVPQPV
ncbi:MAG TPA: hypothetical protein VK110_09175 [Salinisphaeraceae bacterium]|nr:hypothetical protein [Salinisphaeraceae bacterium]